MKQTRLNANVKAPKAKEYLQSISEINEANLRGGLRMTGRDIVIHTSCGDDII